MSETNDDAVGFTARNYAKVLRCLVSADGYERLAADELLFSLLLHEKKDAQGRWTGRIVDALASFGTDVDRFLAAVIASTALESEADYRRRLGNRRGAAEVPTSNWRVPELDAYPLETPIVVTSDVWLFRMGVPSWLTGIGPIAVGRVAQLADLLAHPEFSDCVFEALASIGVDAREALDAMLRHLMKVGPHSSINKAPEGLLRVAVNEVSFDARLLDALGESPASDLAARGVCEVLWRLPQVDVGSVDHLYDLARSQANSECRSAFAWAGTRLSRRQGLDATRWLELAHEFAHSEDDVLRSAAAQMLRDEPATGFGEDVVCRLARDEAAFVRMHAYQAASSWCDPPVAVIDAAAADLGSTDAFDDEPGYAAAMALGAWMHASAHAMDSVVAWANALPRELERSEESSIVVAKIEAIAQGLGAHAKPLLPAIEAIAAYFEAKYADDDSAVGDDADDEGVDVDAASNDDNSRDSGDFFEPAAEIDPEEAESARIRELSDPMELARRLGIPVDEHIPGSLDTSTDESDEEHHTRMRRLAIRIAAL